MVHWIPAHLHDSTADRYFGEPQARKTGFPSEDAAPLASPSLLNSEHNGEYARNTIARYEDLQNLALALSRGSIVLSANGKSSGDRCCQLSINLRVTY
jgi:hypothetical protein